MNAPHPVARTEGGFTHHNTIVLGRPRITAVSLEAVYVRETHAVVRDWEKDWSAQGDAATDPSSTNTRSDPWTTTIGEKLKLRLDYRAVSALAGPEPFFVRGHFKNVVSFNQAIMLRGDMNRVEIESVDRLPLSCAPLIGELELTLTHGIDASFQIEHTMKLDGAVTFGVPEHGYEWDYGITWKRVVEATHRIRALGTSDPHAIAKQLVAIVPAYTTTPSDALKDLDHPKYKKTQRGGAWPLLDHIAERAECQAIVRLALALMRQAGCPGELTWVNVWAEKTGASVTYHEEEGPEGGLPDDRSGAFRVLLDHELVVGKRDTVASSGLNRYEACLRVRHGGVTKYYPGGMYLAEFDSPSEVISAAFWGLADAVWVGPQGEDRSRWEFVITRIIHRWK